MLGVDFGPTLDRVRAEKPMPPGDQFAGNRMRLESTITLKTDERWRSEMPRWMQWLVTMLCLPVSLFVLRKQPPVGTTKPEHKSAA